ncbi:hypothetical protein [Siminovitchia fordii]|uniref:Uncharacterized protein n=1 Tax=Siminovitchia fordii TaxID=254759 RepID=A0ABQ4KDZ3_9BACI|nr:hypothetical protein [Siminovitchia fordii]GIN23098.1 hypothetical protein J1TS3_42320 [Siminovitchia fordii]
MKMNHEERRELLELLRVLRDIHGNDFKLHNEIKAVVNLLLEQHEVKINKENNNLHLRGKTAEQVRITIPKDEKGSGVWIQNEESGLEAKYKPVRTKGYFDK